MLDGKQIDVRQPKKSLVMGIVISYKFLDTQECGSTRGKDALFERASDVQVVCPSEPEDRVVGHGCGFRIRWNNHPFYSAAGHFSRVRLTKAAD
jgi:hypothetical protein